MWGLLLAATAPETDPVSASAAARVAPLSAREPRVRGEDNDRPVAVACAPHAAPYSKHAKDGAGPSCAGSPSRAPAQARGAGALVPLGLHPAGPRTRGGAAESRGAIRRTQAPTARGNTQGDRGGHSRAKGSPLIVIDASVAVELLIGGPRATALQVRIAREALHAPHLIDVEVAHVLRRLHLARLLSDVRGRRALESFVALDVTRHDHDILLGRVWALRAGVTAYDAVYIALAEGLQAPLLTLDARLSRATGHRALIEVF